MKRSTTKNWHPANIVATLHKHGISLAKLSWGARLALPMLMDALRHLWPKGEWLVANVLEVHPSKI